MVLRATGAFEIEMRTGDAELEGAANRHDFTKTYTGDVVGRGIGVMLSGGDPSEGTAGYVAFEIFHGRVHDAEGSFMLQQFGQMTGGAQRLHYEIVSGSGTDELTGIAGTLDLTIDEHGHTFELDYTLP